MTRVLFVDDHTLVRESIVDRIAQDPDITVVGQAATGEQAITEAIEKRPDLVVMDIDIPGLSSFDAVRTILARNPECLIIFLTAHQHDEYIEQAIDVGARGYVLKSDGIDELRTAILAVTEGRLHYSEQVLSRLAIEGNRLRLRSPSKTRLSTLSKREKELLRLLAQGYSVKDAATVLNVSPKTADNQKVNLMRKLDIHDRVALARYAIREGLVNP
jgi:DNA-binding NarL/FixJ family response regulator